jgi:aminopeptidase
MPDPRITRLAQVLVGYSTQVQPGDRVLIEAEVSAEPLVRALFQEILIKGGHPHIALSLSGMTTMTGVDDAFMAFAQDSQLDYPPTFFNHAYENFEARIRIWSESNTMALANVEAERLARRSRAIAPVTRTQFERGDRGEFRWATTMFPTSAYAQLAEMNLSAYQDFFYRACHVDREEGNPIAVWRQVEHAQQLIVDRLNGSEQIVVRGPNCDLSLSVKGRTFINACGRRNMPDGEVFTGPVEESVNGWVRFSLPASLKGNIVEGIELKFEDGRVTHAQAEKNQRFLEQMLATDVGANFVGEFALGLNYDIQRPTGKILLDEKIGGTMHMALGAGYPKTGSQNTSAIHWDMITDMHDGGEVEVDGEVLYRDGRFNPA